MREIKFRGKGMHTKKWFYGFVWSYIQYGSNETKWFIKESDGADREVDYNSIGQYTGLSDKNGVEIFEGDICKWLDKDIPYKIAWSISSFVLEDNKGKGWAGLSTGDFIEVIGNIHENPDLLEQNV